MVEKRVIFNDFNIHLINDDKPSEYFNEEISTKSYFTEHPFKLLKDLVDTTQSPIYHPEGSVWNHTMMVLDNAANLKDKSQDSRAFMWAALLHDIGKAPTTKIRKGKITSYDHDILGDDLASEFLLELTDDLDFTKKVSKIVRWHMQPLYVSKNLPFAHIEEMNKEVTIDEIALFSLCDRLGRGGLTEEKVKAEKEEIKRFIESSKRLV